MKEIRISRPELRYITISQSSDALKTDLTFTLKTGPAISRGIWQNNSIKEEEFCYEEV